MSRVVSNKVVADVRLRANDYCEYCKMPFGLTGTEFEIDHIISRSLKGDDSFQNLAWSCFRCNSNKGPHVGAIDPFTGKVQALFNPRSDNWHRHFRMTKGRIVARTAKARTTLALLEMNDSNRVFTRSIFYETRPVE